MVSIILINFFNLVLINFLNFLLGYRIKLHFDGFPIDYDFWVNADCPDLFYPGWCKQNSRILQPPKNYKGKFDWTSYLNSLNALPAPLHNFASSKTIVVNSINIF